jgi:hypothetical protein
MMKGLCRHSYQAPDRRTDRLLGITEAKLPKEFHLSNLAPFPRTRRSPIFRLAENPGQTNFGFPT